MSISRSGGRFRSARRLLISLFQSGLSGMFHSGNPVYCLNESAPAALLSCQHFLAFRCQFVIATATLSGFLYPSPLYPASLFQAVEQRVERSDVETDNAVGSRFDQFADLVSVSRTSL